MGPQKEGKLAIRRCEAVLTWGKDRLSVATDAAEVDLDAFGADLELGVPVAAFQIKQSDRDCCMRYLVYSLNSPPHLLRNLSGGSYFNAADTDLDGNVEIWTNDAAAINGFDNLNLVEFDHPPTMVLRLLHGKLLDASSEFKTYYDDEIAAIRAGLAADKLREFKNSDGQLHPSNTATAELLHDLRRVKKKVLEIVWAYLYSGREQEALNTLAEMWPESDLVRIRAVVLRARAQGIEAQVQGTSEFSAHKKRRHENIFDAVGEPFGGKPEIRAPEPILLSRPPQAQINGQNSEELLTLLIDSAGKVRTAEIAGNGEADPALVQAAAGWKFIPAFKDGQAVACRMRLSVSQRQ